MSTASSFMALFCKDSGVLARWEKTLDSIKGSTFDPFGYEERGHQSPCKIALSAKKTWVSIVQYNCSLRVEYSHATLL